jgi:MFS family permease
MSLLYSPSLTKSSPPRIDARTVGMLGGGIPFQPVGGVATADSSNAGARRFSPGDEVKWQHLYVLPVLLLEFLALALTRAVIPSLLLQEYGNRVYLVMGFADFIRGSLAFVACPLFGKISDIVGRRWCLLVTVFGTCAPVCSLAFFTWDTLDLTPASVLMPNQFDVTQQSALNGSFLDSMYLNVSDASSSAMSASESSRSDESGVWPAVFDTGTVPPETANDAIHRDGDGNGHPLALTVFIILLSLSGIFSSTFTLVFAYISDTVRNQEERVSAYGLALATFGLSFTIGPMAGGYLAKYDRQYVFVASLVMTILDLVYIYLFLPESRPYQQGTSSSAPKSSNLSAIAEEHNISWKPWDTLRIVALDPFLRKVGEVAFLYYTGLWAIISTLSVYAVKRFHLTPERLGELMSALGLCTMVAEAVLVRIAVPMLGEKKAMRLGLASFCVQCVVLGLAYEGWHLFVCVIFSLAGNLVYPSLTSLVSGSVEPDAVGEALGAVNGIKALTEGIGPLLFGSLMTLSEHSRIPGWPYLLASILNLAAFRAAGDLPDPDADDVDEYIHELDQKGRYQGGDDGGGILMRVLDAKDRQREDEYEGLLSDIDESDGERNGPVHDTSNDESDGDDDDDRDMTRLPTTFASLIQKSFSPKRR